MNKQENTLLQLMETLSEKSEDSRNVDFDDITRKYSISTILYGNEMHSMDVLHAFCSAEKIDNQERRRIGF